MLDTLLGWLAPYSCYSCGRLGQGLCHKCKNNIINQLQQLPCPFVETRQAGVSVYYDAIWTVAFRQGVLADMVDDVKFAAKRGLAKELADVLAVAAPKSVQEWQQLAKAQSHQAVRRYTLQSSSEGVRSDNSVTDDVIVTWVPTALSHVRQRGVDHAKLLARWYARYVDLPSRQLLVRRHQLAQKTAESRQQRARQADTAYAVAPHQKDYVSGSQIILIDDIITTGYTINAAARQLREAGAVQVYVLTVLQQIN